MTDRVTRELASLDRYLALRASRTNELRFADFEAILVWTRPIEPLVRARALSAMLAATASDEMADRCSEAIAAVDQWPSLVIDLVTYGDTAPVTFETIRSILQARQPEHPLAHLGRGPLRVVSINDGLDDGDLIRASGYADQLTEGSWLLLDRGDPLHQHALADVYHDGSDAIIVADGAGWLDRTRVACPAFVAIAA